MSGWFRRKASEPKSRESSPEREPDERESVASAERSSPRKRRFKFSNDKNRWYWKFVQQRLPGWAPIITANWVIFYFLTVTIVCIAIGVPVLVASLNIKEYSTRYDNLGTFAGKSKSAQQDLLYGQSGNGLPLTASIFVHDKMDPPIYVFYQLGAYYQNYKRYVRSRSDQQNANRGGTATACAPERTVNATTNSSLPDDGNIDPCGLVAWSFFNDSFAFTADNAPLSIDSNNIAWTFDRDHLYGPVQPENYNIYPEQRGGNTSYELLNQNQHFMVWMRPGAKPTIRKLYGQIDQTIPAGTTVSIAIQNRYNTYNYGGQKTIVLSTNSWVGGRNLFLGIAYLVAAGLALIAALTFLVCYHLGLVGRRKFGDLSQLSWNRKAFLTS